MQQTAYARIAYERRGAEKRRGQVEFVRKRKSVMDILRDFCRNLISFLFTQVGVCALLIIYNIIGAVCFRQLEGINGDSSVEEKAGKAQDHLVASLWNVTVQYNVLEEEIWRKHAEGAIAQYQQILVPLIRWKGYRGVMPIDAWTIPGALMYSLSIYTTIGYGNLIPRTEAGKVATIFYAFLGMPLMLLYMSNVGEALANIFKFVYFGLCNCKFNNDQKNKQVQRISQNNSKELNGISNQRRHTDAKDLAAMKLKRDSKSVQQNEIQTIPILWCLLVIAVYVIIGGMLFSHWEGWSMLNGCYFCYISLSTIGFGDLVPGRVLDRDDLTTGVENRQIVATIYLLVGMALVAMCFNLMQEEALDTLKSFWRGLGLLRAKRKKKSSTSTASIES